MVDCHCYSLWNVGSQIVIKFIDAKGGEVLATGMTHGDGWLGYRNSVLGEFVRWDIKTKLIIWSAFSDNHPILKPIQEHIMLRT